MLAAFYERYGAARDVIRVGDLPDPAPGPGEVLVRVHASGINPSDVKTRMGSRGTIPGPVVVPHNDGGGVIEAAGPGVDPGRVGERVWLYNVNRSPDGTRQGTAGTAAQRVAVPAVQAVPLPEGTSFAEAACLGVPAMTAHLAVLGGGPVHGRTVLVTGGAGAVGWYAIQIAKWAGAFVLATVSSEAKAKRAAQAGADHVINYRTEDVAARGRDLTGGHGADLIVEVEFGGNLAASTAALAPGGVIAPYGSVAQPKPALDFFPLMFRNGTIRGVFVYAMSPEAFAAARHDIIAMLRHGRLKHLIAETFDLADCVAAHEAVESGRLIGNAVLTIP
ncbi:MAG: NADPH:quinone reductase [Alphaproteobacteria bacterium]